MDCDISAAWILAAPFRLAQLSLARLNVGAHSAIKDGQTLLQLVLFRLDPGAAKIALSFSWSDQRSSSDIDLSSSFFDKILMPCKTNSGFNIAAPHE